MLFKKGSSGWYMGQPIEQVWYMGQALFPASSSFDVLDPFNDASAIAYYSFDDDLVDAIGGNNGSATTPTYESGVNNDSLAVNVSANTVTTQDRFPIPDNFTISLWVKRDNASNGWVLCNRSNSTSSAGETQLGYYSSESGMFFNIQTGDGWFTVHSTSLLYSNTHGFKYVTCTVDDASKTIKIYVDGVLEDTVAYTGTRYKGSEFGTFGALYSSSFPLNGALDDAHFFNRALTDNEVEYLYQNMGGI